MNGKEKSKTYPVLAKSEPDMSLCHHIDDCRNLLKQFSGCFPNIPLSESSSFWALLDDCAIFHDTGKAHVEFQRILHNKADGREKWYNQRHELFSLYFINQAVQPEEKKLKIEYVVAGHHKSIRELDYFIQHTYAEDEQGCLSYKEECLKLWKNKVWKILAGYGFSPQNNDTVDVNNLIQRLYRPVCNIEGSRAEFFEKLLLVGFMKQADHMASAGIKKVQKLSDANFSFLYSHPLYNHQIKACETDGNIILSSPTGSGKTEAALLWMKRHLVDNKKEGRVYYVLPYTASINAMYERLSRNFDGEEKFVGMIHGKLSQYIENKMSGDDNISFQNQGKALFADFCSLVTPLKIVTPFQLLKYLFGLKGFEKGIAEWCGGYFIIDEIHAYDSRTFAQIIVLLEFCVRYMNVRICIMSATLPSFMLDILEKSIGPYTRIEADDELYGEFIRHRVRIESGKIQDSLWQIQKELDSGKKVLVVCNTVEQAQQVYVNLSASAKLLLHGAFNSEDRFRKEMKLQSEEVKLLVGTQAIEVSLDVDYDTIYSEPAPIDALLQRFGRVNRKKEKGICVCHVFSERNENDRFIYSETIVSRTLSLLNEIAETQSGIIDEKDVGKMMNKVYPAWEDKSKQEYDLTYKLLTDYVLKDLSPLTYNPTAEEKFYKQFSGIRVLPVCLVPRYRGYLNSKQFVKAEGLLVSIRESQLYRLINENNLYKDTFYYEDRGNSSVNSKDVIVILRKYDSDLGLRINESDSYPEDNIL